MILRAKRIATQIAESAGATAELVLGEDPNPVVVNDPALTARVLPSLQRAAGAAKRRRVIPYTTISEDFAQFGQRVPSFFFTVGVTPVGKDTKAVPSNHSSEFFMDEGALPVGLRSMLGRRTGLPARHGQRGRNSTSRPLRLMGMGDRQRHGRRVRAPARPVLRPMGWETVTRQDGACEPPGMD